MRRRPATTTKNRTANANANANANNNNNNNNKTATTTTATASNATTLSLGRPLSHWNWSSDSASFFFRRLGARLLAAAAAGCGHQVRPVQIHTFFWAPILSGSMGNIQQPAHTRPLTRTLARLLALDLQHNACTAPPSHALHLGQRAPISVSSAFVFVVQARAICLSAALASAGFVALSLTRGALSRLLSPPLSDRLKAGKARRGGGRQRRRQRGCWRAWSLGPDRAPRRLSECERACVCSTGFVLPSFRALEPSWSWSWSWSRRRGESVRMFAAPTMPRGPRRAGATRAPPVGRSPRHLATLPRLCLDFASPRRPRGGPF